MRITTYSIPRVIAVLVILFIGAYTNIYTNDGFWEISRTTLKGYLEYTFESGYIAQAGYRYVDFKEKSSDAGFNDYKAHIFEISFGYRWE